MFDEGCVFVYVVVEEFFGGGVGYFVVFVEEFWFEGDVGFGCV